MTPDRNGTPAPDTKESGWRSAMPLFDRWVDADEAERAGLLARAAADAEVHAHLLRLIAADDRAEHSHFLDGNAVLDAADDDTARMQDLGGARLGAWRLRSLLGVGGSGQVWLAQRDDGLHGGTAALKLLRTFAPDSRAQLRFAREGRVLARLQHANIARLLDVGQAPLTNAPAQQYLVLEYVDGERVDVWCDRRHASIEARVRLFLQICDAVVYAHANLIVHRDIKPSNILVQADGVAKLLDFGVAKLLEAEGTDAAPASEPTELTRAGVAPFTPEYAAPEQFEHQPTTVATDVYSLGVVLYVLLAGRRPYGDDAHSSMQLTQAALHESPRRLSSSFAERTQDTARIANARGVTAPQLRRLLRGDLDTIVAKALKKDPAERYASAQDFGDDLRRYLDHRPIRARGDGGWYVVRKFAARHRVSVGLVSFLLPALLIAGIALWVEARHLKVEVTRATAIKDFMIDTFRNADAYEANGKPAMDAVSIVQQAASEVEQKFPEDAATRAEMYAAFGRIFTRLARYDDARNCYLKAASLTNPLYGEASLPALALEANSVNNEWMSGNVAVLMPRIERLVRLTSDLPPAQARIRWSALEAETATAITLGDMEHAHASAERYVRDVVSQTGMRSYEYTFALWRLATVDYELGIPREADRLMRDVAALDRVLVAPTHPGLATDLETITDILIDYGDYREAQPIANTALELRRRMRGQHHPAVAELYDRTAVIAGALGQDERAEQDFTEATATGVAAGAPHAREFALVHYDFGIYLLQRRRLDAAQEQFALCARVFDDTPQAWHFLRAACASAAAYCAARVTGGDTDARRLDSLIVEQREHASRELATALWLRTRLAEDRVTAETAEQQLAWLDEAEAQLDRQGRGGSALRREIETRRLALGAAPRAAQYETGRELVAAANAIIAVAK